MRILNASLIVFLLQGAYLLGADIKSAESRMLECQPHYLLRGVPGTKPSPKDAQNSCPDQDSVEGLDALHATSSPWNESEITYTLDWRGGFGKMTAHATSSKNQTEFSGNIAFYGDVTPYPQAAASGIILEKTAEKEPQDLESLFFITQINRWDDKVANELKEVHQRYPSCVYGVWARMQCFIVPAPVAAENAK